MSTPEGLSKGEEQQHLESPKTPENSLSAREKVVAREGKRPGRLAVKRTLVISSDDDGNALKRAATSERLPPMPLQFTLPQEELQRINMEEEAKRKIEEAVLDFQVKLPVRLI